MKKVLTWLLAIAMVFSVVCSGVPHAFAEANKDLELQVTKNDDTVTLNLVMKTNQTLGGICCNIGYDKNAFDYVGAESGKLSITENATEMNFAMDATNASVAAGETVATWTFTTKDAYVEGNEYSFTMTRDDVAGGFYDIGGDDLDLGEIPPAVLKEEVTPPATIYTVTFMANGEQFGEPVEVEEGNPVAKPANIPAAPQGKRFAYWALNGAKYDFSKPVTGNLTLTAVFEDVPKHEITIKKTVEAAVDYGTKEFTFTITPANEDPYVGPVENVTAPTINGPITVNMPTTDTVKVSLDSITWPAGGVYTYIIKETPGAAGDGWVYDRTEYTLKIKVEPNANTGALEVTEVLVMKGTDTSKKDVQPEFNNKYEPVTDLTIKKVVAGSPTPTDGYGTEEFSFTVTFDQGFEGTVNGVAHTFEEKEPYTFTLKNGEELVIGKIPAGAKYTVVEGDTPYYTATATVVNGTDTPTVPDGAFGEGITVGPITIAAAGAGVNTVTVTNTYSITPPTGVVIHGEMIGIALLVLVALAGSFILSRKLRRA